MIEERRTTGQRRECVASPSECAVDLDTSTRLLFWRRTSRGPVCHSQPVQGCLGEYEGGHWREVWRGWSLPCVADTRSTCGDTRVSGPDTGTSTGETAYRQTRGFPRRGSARRCLSCGRHVLIRRGRVVGIHCGPHRVFSHWVGAMPRTGLSLHDFEVMRNGHRGH